MAHYIDTNSVRLWLVAILVYRTVLEQKRRVIVFWEWPLTQYMGEMYLQPRVPGFVNLLDAQTSHRT